jgi:hypothetical protein
MEFDHHPSEGEGSFRRTPSRRSSQAGNLQGSEDDDSQQPPEYTDEDLASDSSNFMQRLDRVINYDDLGQRLKGGANINFVGKIKALSRER